MANFLIPHTVTSCHNVMEEFLKRQKISVVISFRCALQEKNKFPEIFSVCHGYVLKQKHLTIKRRCKIFSKMLQCVFVFEQFSSTMRL